MFQLDREYTAEELDALEAQAAAGSAGEPFSVVPTEPPAALGPIAQIDPNREYTAEELDLYEQSNPVPEFTPDELDEKLVTSVLDDPTYLPSRDEYFEAKETKARLKSEGKLPGLLENAATGAKGFIQTLGDMASEITDDPGEFLARSPATMIAAGKKSWRNTNDVGRWLRNASAPDPIGRYEDTGEFLFGQMGAGMDDAEYLARKQFLALEEGRKIRPVTEEDLKDDEYDRFLSERERQKDLEDWIASTTAPTEFVTRLATGRNQMEQPMQATSDVAGMFVEPTNVATMGIPLAAGAKSLGLSRLTKAAGSRGARIIERAAGGTADKLEAGATRLQTLIEKGTRLSPENQVKIAKWSAAGGVGGAAFGMDTDIPVLSQAQDAAKILGGAYIAYKGGVGTLRTVQKVAGPTSVALRIAADPADGLDPIAQAAVATRLQAFPKLAPVREVLENPTRFRAIESTPARIAADPRFGPQTRAIADSLSNTAIVQGVRGASAVAGGAVKGAAANAPFVALALNSDEEKAAANMLGMGAAFGAAGGAIDRVTGLPQRRSEARASDIARMFMDVELAGGDVGKFAQTYSPQQLGDLASMQGFFRSKVDFVPLDKADFDLNTQALGGAGAAGLFVQAPPGEKARVFINLDAKREGIVPHELGHALLKSGALGGMQADSIRAFTTRRYSQAGVETRAREYASTLIANENAAKFPGQNLPISPDAIQAKMDELGQSGLLRGDTDPLDWARDEIFAEDFRQASQSMDFAAIRRNLPADGSWLGSMEGILGAQANALSISGVRIDPVTGQPDPLFKTNPILDTDPVLKKQLGQYLNNYRNWINHPDQTKARGVRVAPTARPQDLANNPLITFHDYGNGVMATEFAAIDPATGQVVLRNQRDINADTAKRQEQVKNLVGSKLLPTTDPTLGPKKTADGRVTVRGRTLPQQFDFLNGFAQHQRGFARQLETAAAAGESLMVRYHSIGTGDSGSFRVRNLGNLEAITREVIPWGWELTSKGNLLTSVLDLTQFRNRALKAINAGDPTLGRLYNNDLKLIEGDLKQWMDNHRQDLPGSNKIGEQRRDAINSLIGIATNINKGANPFSGKIAGPSSAIKQFRLDRLDAATGTGRTGFHFDYDKANGNLLPEVATPLPDLSRDLPGQALPDNDTRLRAINIDDSTQDFTGQILRGEKIIETRDSPSLSPYVGRRVAIAKTLGSGKPTIVGYADVGEPTIYDSVDKFRSDFNLHKVSPGSKYDIKPSGIKYGYPFLNVESVKPTPLRETVGRIATVIEDPTYISTPGQAMPDAADAIGLESAKFLREAVGDGMENLRQKMAKRPGTGIAKNKFVRFHTQENKPIYIGAIQKDGGKSFAGWIEETEAWQSPAETSAYREWYKELKGHFTEIFGPKAGEMMMAWLAAQQNVSPGGALGNVFKVEDRLAGIGTGKKGGLADGKIEGILLRQVPEKGFGQKLTDFVDAGFLREFRTYMGSKPEGGRPFVADVHTGRDSGHVDQQTLTRLADQSKQGNLFIDGQPAKITITETKTVQVGGKQVKVPERVKVSVPGKKSFEIFVDQRGSPGGGQYEGISEWGNAMTDHLNNINWRGGKWTPAEVQAVGWMRVLRQYGLAEPTVLSALQQNTSKIFAEVNYGSGNLIPANFPAFETLPPDAQRAITTDVLTDTVNEVANLIGGSLRVQKISSATGAWGNFRSPTTAIEVLGSAEATDLLGLALATVSEQAATMSATFGVGGKDSRVLVFKKADGTKFNDAEMQSIIDDAGISGYTMQHLPGGDAGIIADATKDFKPKGLSEKRAEQMTQKLVAWADKNGIVINVEDSAARITSYANDWTNNTDGQTYLSSIIERGGSSKIRDIVRFRRRYAEILQQSFERHAPGVIADPPATIKPFQAAVDAPSAEMLKMFSP